MILSESLYGLRACYFLVYMRRTLSGIDTTDAGAIKIKDEKTGAEVTLQSSEVKEISQDEYEAGLKGQPPKR